MAPVRSSSAGGACSPLDGGVFPVAHGISQDIQSVVSPKGHSAATVPSR